MEPRPHTIVSNFLTIIPFCRTPWREKENLKRIRVDLPNSINFVSLLGSLPYLYPWSDQRTVLIQLYLKAKLQFVPRIHCVPPVQPLRSVLVASRKLTRGSERRVKFF